MLERWGLRVCGGSLKSPIRMSTGGEAGIDDDLFLVEYVETTTGFGRARPVLLHRYAHGRPFSSFQLRQPGEPRSRALIRWGWFDMVGFRDSDIPKRIVEEFETFLAERMRISPFVPPSERA